MKKTLLLAFAALGSFGAFAQNYFRVSQTGTADPYSSSATATVALAAGSNDVLSSAVTIPFTWNFYGMPVTQYKVSDNGYITFNTAATTSVSANVALPSASAPRSAIFAFWDNLELKAISGSSVKTEARYYTYGSAPKRVHVIQWFTASKEGAAAGGSNYLYFAIRLYEGGDFDVIYNDASPSTASVSATIGCQDSSGTNGMMVTGSPSLDFPNKLGQQDGSTDKVYKFIYGTQLPLQAKVVENKTAPIAATNVSAGTPITVSFTNWGTTDITSAKFNYTINGGTTVTAPVTASIASNGGMTIIAHPTTFKPVTADEGTSKNVVAWLSEINGGTTSSDTAMFTVWVNKGITGTKHVMLEEGSGAWCGYCPDGHIRLRDILDANGDKVIGVVHHNADGMTNSESDIINTAYATGYPYGMVDRVLYPDQNTVGLNRTIWASKVSSRLNATTPVNVSIQDKTFDAATRKVSYSVKVEFVDYALPGDLRVNTFIVEDKVRGPKISNTNTTWNQHNYYSKDDAQVGGSGHELYEEPAYFFGYHHNHVVRKVPSTAWGDAGVITDASMGKTYTKAYTYTFPADVNVTYTENPEINTPFQSTANGVGMNKHYDSKIVAFVSYYNADTKKREILNAIEVPVSHGVGIAEAAKNNASISSVSPNPASGFTRVDFNLTSKSNVTVEVLNIVGQKVMTVKEGTYAEGDHTVAFDSGALTNGVYFISIKTAEGSATHKIIVNN